MDVLFQKLLKVLLLRILIAEDNEIILKIINIHLQRFGFETVLTRNGQEAWEQLYGGSQFDLLISDIMMPEMDGLDLVRKIKADPDLMKIPILICSSKDDKETVKAAIILGCNDYVLKPINASQLLQKVNKLLEQPKR